MPISARLVRHAALGLAVATLGACGGGLWIGIDGSWGDDRAPSVSIASAATSAVAGGTLRVVAAAADDDGIDEVSFFRRDGNRWTLLGSDGTQPYEWMVAVPVDGRSVLEVYARATDRSGWQADSEVLQVSIVH